jgi:hypothetical protein
MQINVGKKYRRLDGEIVEITGPTHPFSEFAKTNPFATADGRSYTAEGKYLSLGTEHRFDLVEEIVDEQAATEASEGVCVELDLSPGAVIFTPGGRHRPAAASDAGHFIRTDHSSRTG